MAGNWTFYESLRENLGQAKFDFQTDAFRCALLKSTSNAATDTINTYGSLTNEVNASWNYATGGKTLTGTSWKQGASGNVWQFDASPLIWTASGGTITSIMYAAIYETTSNRLVCYSQLSSAIFAVTDANTLTVTMSANGVFELS